MSLFIGSSSTGKVLHITNEVNTETEMQSGLLPSTVYHSDLEFLTYTIHTIDSKLEDKLFVGEYGKFVRGSGVMASTALSSIRSGKLYLLLDSNLNVVPTSTIGDTLTDYEINYPSLFTETVYKSIDTTVGNYDGNVTTTLADTTHILLKQRTTNASKIIVFNVNVEGVVEGPTKDSSGVLLGDGGITVDGVNLATLKYVSNNSVGNSSPIRMVDGSNNFDYFHLVNKDGNSGDTLELKSSPLTGTVIELGGNEILSSNIANQKLHTGLSILDYSNTLAGPFSVTGGIQHHVKIGSISSTYLGKPCVLMMAGGGLSTITFINLQTDSWIVGHSSFGAYSGGYYSYVFVGVYLDSNRDIWFSTYSGGSHISWNFSIRPGTLKINLLGKY